MIGRAWIAALVLAASPVAAQSPAPAMSLTLAQALARADSTSPAVGIAQAGVTTAQAGWLRARAGYLPQLSGTATYTRTLASEFSGLVSGSPADTFPAPTNCTHFHANPSLPVTDRLDSLERGLECAGTDGFNLSSLPFGQANTWSFGLTGSQSLFDRRIHGQVAAANATRDQATIEVDAQHAAAALATAQAYFDAQLAQRLVDIADSTLAQAQRTYDQTRLERQVGNAAEFDQLRASVARDNQNPVVIQRRAQRDLAVLRLLQLLDLPAGTSVLLTTPLSDTGAVPLPAAVARVATRDTAVMSRAPVREAQASLAASDAQLGSARAEHLPTLGLSSTYSKIDFPAKVFSFSRFLTDWEVNVQLSVPIFNGGRMHADAIAAEATRDVSALRVKQAEQQAQLDVQDAANQLVSARSAWQASLGTIDQATRAYSIAELRYENGLSTLTDVADARLQLGQAQANTAQALHDLQIARIRLLLLPELPFSGASAGSAPAMSGGANAGSGGNTTAAPPVAGSANPAIPGAGANASRGGS
ncbi:MAG TPA: TolC family protein [Gemmatimonadales bacterium]|nr:TolC family protein [Gemmatimonadales bacterium]